MAIHNWSHMVPYRSDILHISLNIDSETNNRENSLAVMNQVDEDKTNA